MNKLELTHLYAIPMVSSLTDTRSGPFDFRPSLGEVIFELSFSPLFISSSCQAGIEGLVIGITGGAAGNLDLKSFKTYSRYSRTNSDFDSRAEEEAFHRLDLLLEVIRLERIPCGSLFALYFEH